MNATKCYGISWARPGKKRALDTRAQRRPTPSKQEDPMSAQEWMRRKRAGAKLEDLPSILEMKDKSIGEWWERLPARMVESSVKKSSFEEELQKLADKKFRGLRNWKEIHGELRNMKIKSLSPKDVRTKVLSGKLVLIDVREPEKFQAGHVQNAINVPLYTSGITGEDAWDKLRKAVFAGFAMKGTERNPNFYSDAVAALDGNLRKEVAVLCGTGGTLETSEERLARRSAAAPMGEWGNASRSLMAIHELKQGGFKNVIHVEGGHALWCSEYRSDVV